MNKYAVSYVSHFDSSDLKLEIVEADGWKDALSKVSSVRADWLSDDLEEIKEGDMCSGSYTFAVKEI